MSTSSFNKLHHGWRNIAAAGLALTVALSGQTALANGERSLAAERVFNEQAEQPAADKRQSDMKPDKKVAIIIDDFGNGQGGTEEMLSLPIKLTVAIMPFLPTSKTDAELAHKQGHDVIVHMPMEPKQGNPKWLGPGAITSNMSNEEIRQRVEEAIDNVPYAVGMNNHMGSKITGDERIMSIVLEVCRERGLFFVDSKTNYHSVVGKLAVQMGMPPVANNIFLDDRHTVSHVSKQMKAVETWASEHQNCVTIGHVGVQGKKTAEAIRQSITGMQNSVSFVGISDLVRDIWDWKPAPILPSNNS
ncbi:divergent polysaccharide deacetylase family protein [Paenibacillus cellulositrophicus]|uniref:divergent polysaccharide deacetylase family protein n=1 Tax=Paenibacillus cellulositrophicus TaxID=562959 RepID=UPI00203D4C6A|nr:divergent polysaccharide deacetylase family protein [Paenibacillus cellulositrophicus]MCM2996812.1 divergent polysaccharide deacetylase family protein [Paenibacillus cellulositrophicus]